MWFVRHLGPGDTHLLATGVQYEVQILDAAGLGIAVLQFSDEGSPLYFQDDDMSVAPLAPAPEGSSVLAGRYEIPDPVLVAAMRQAAGKGDYVDNAGHSIPPF